MKVEKVTALLIAAEYESEELRDVALEVKGHFTKFETSRDRILADKNLSDVGQLNALEREARETEAAVRAIEEKKLIAISRAEQAANVEIEKTLTATDPMRYESDPNGTRTLAREIARELRQGDIRRDLSNLDPLELQSFYGVCEDAEVRAAIEQAPARIQRVKDGVTLGPWIPAEAIAVRRLSAARASNPEAAKRLEILEGLRTGVLNITTATLATLHRAAPGAPVFKDQDGRVMKPIQPVKK